MSWMEALVPFAGATRPMIGALLLFGQVALAGGVPPPGDFQYFLPQEFLLDLPIREGSFATEVMNTLRSLNFPDVHAKDVDAGVFENVYATSDLNAPAYKAGRRICTRVPPGYNEADDPNLCEREGATAPQAIINSPTPGVAYSEGNFRLVAEFEVDIVGYLHVWTQTCLVLCWENQLCNDDITITGAFRVTSSVEVGRQPVTGQISLLPSTSFKFLEGPFTTGCREDWVASLFADVDNEISVAVRTLMEKWVRKNLQSQLQTQQRVQLMPRLAMIYQIVKLDFVPDWQSEHERGYVRVCAVTTVQATAANGTVQSFPDPLQAWTGRHNPTPLSPSWNRTIWYGEAQRVLLGGVRFSQEMLTMLFQGMHFAGVLSPHGSSIVHDAQVLSHVDVAQPTLRIREEGQGALLEEPTLQVGVACPDTSHGQGSGVFRLLDATFSGVAQRVIVSSYVAEDHSAMGLTLALSDVSLATANMTAFSSSTFFGSEGHLKALAERALRSAMPRLNRRLARAPLLFCGGGGSSCALVPLVPHPEVRTVPEQGLGRPGFVQLSWACSCTAGGEYQRCKGHICPRQAQLESQQRRLRGGPGDGGVVVKARPAHRKHIPGTLYLATFSPVRSAEAAHCVFASAGDTLRFGALRPSRARVATAPGAEDLLGTAYRLERQPHGRFRLHLGCDEKSTAPCRYHTQPVRLHECGVLKPSGPQAQDDEELLVPFFLSRVSTLAPAADSLAAGQPAASSPPASPSGCLGGHKDYGQNDTLLMAVVGGASSASATPFTFAVHLGGPGSASGCVPCGVDGNLWCSAEPSSTSATSLSASLLCKQCSSGVPTGCLLGGSSDASANQARLGQWFEVLAGSPSVRNPGGYSKVTLVTRQTVPLLQPCPRPKQEPQPAHQDWLSMAPIALAASAGLLAMAASVAGGYLLKGRTCCSCCSHRATRLLPRLHFLPPEDNLQSLAHGLLWVGASLLLACGLVWLLENPLVHLLDEMRATTDMHNGFDNEVADRIVQRSCYVGLAIFAASASFLAALSLSMLFVLEWPCLSSTGVEVEALIANGKQEDESVEDNREVQPIWDLSFWFPAVVFLLSESNSAFAFLAFCFWRRAGGNFTLLGGDTYAGETTTAVFSIRLLLTWIAPFLLATHSLPIATLVAYTRGLASSVTSGERWRVAGAAQPFVLASVLVNASIELILSIVYYRSGYGRIWVLYIMLGGVSMNVVTFLVLAPRSRPSRSSPGGSDEVVEQAGCCSLAAYPLLLLQVAGTGALLVCLADRCAWHFLLAACLTAAYLAWASAQLFLRATSASFQEDEDDQLCVLPQMVSTGDEDAEAETEERRAWPIALRQWLLEEREAKDRVRYGSRIKWRRLCLLMGSASLAVSAFKTVRHNLTFDAWADVGLFLQAVVGQDVVMSQEQASVFRPLVQRYGQARIHHMVCVVVGAALFAVAAGLDVFSSGSPKLLKACRLFGFLGTLSYVLGILIGNMPDYVGMLDFTPTLGRCGSDFCNAVAASMRAAFGAALLAQSGAMFIPVLVSLPWTLGRIGFFLSVDSANKRAVAALTWGTLTCMLRLSILPATVAFVYRPVALIAVWYVLFLVAPSLFLLWVIVTRRTNLLWYLVWGWAFFLVPLLAMGSVAMEEGVWTLWCRISESLFSEENWPNSVAEFTLSDVVISDMFFMIL